MKQAANPNLDFADMANPSLKIPSKIIMGDVLEVLPHLDAAQKFDIIIADPPYNIGKDFGNNKDTMPIGEYVEWSQKWIDSCWPVLADDGVIYVYGFPEILAHVAVQYPIDNQRWLAWHYTNKAVPSSKFWQRSYESILCLWHREKPRPALEIDQIREPYTETYMTCVGRERATTESRFGGKNGKPTTYKAHENGALPRDVIKLPALAGGAGASERWFMCHDCGNEVFPPCELKNHRTHNILKHPTQKPLELSKRLILSRINAATKSDYQGRVLIPFAGSGSECVAAAELGVAYLGIEINPVFVDFANKWLKNV